MSSRDHSFYQDLLEQHISGAPLPPSARFSLFDHVETCDDCRMILEAEERITARMKSVPRLVAPSDLRSKILSQAIRDHRERTTTPSDDPTVADVLKSKFPTGSMPTVPTPAPVSPAADIPVFAGVTAPARGRFHRVWRRASPTLAMVFLAVAGISAFYNDQFQFVTAFISTVGKPSPATTVAQYEAPAPAAFPAPVAAPAAGLTTSPHGAAIANAPRARPLPGTETVVDLMQKMRAWGESADSTVAALASVSEPAIPPPAEKTSPQIAALVLRSTDRENTGGGFQPSGLADALEAAAQTQAGGRIERQDQFAMDGHRYRLYTLELPSGSTNQMLETLSPYQASTDGLIVNALLSQDRVPALAPRGAVQFYASNEAHLRSALRTITPVSGRPGSIERLRVIVVE